MSTTLIVVGKDYIMYILPGLLGMRLSLLLWEAVFAIVYEN